MTDTKEDYKHLRSFAEELPPRGSRFVALGSQRFDLRAAGMDIITETGTGRNRYGKPVKFAVYRLAGGA